MDSEDADVPAWLDAAFFEKTLRDADDFDADAKVVKVDVREGVAKGENFGSFMHKAAVTIKRGDGQLSTSHFMVKSLPDGEAFIKLILESDIFKKETNTYSLLLPTFRRLQVRAGTPVTPLGCKYYRTSRPNTVAMEDLTHRGFRVADRRQRLDLEHCHVALRSLARFHALSLGALKEDPSLKDVFADVLLSASKRGEAQHIHGRTVEGFAKEVATWPGFEQFADRVRSSNVIDKVVDLFIEDSKFSVLCHGDCWLNNMMFRYSDDGKVEELLFVDFQMVRYISLAYDLQFFRFSSVQDEVRVKHWDTLVAGYHAELSATLRSIGCEVTFTLAELQEKLVATRSVGLFTAVLMLPIVLAEPGCSPDFTQLEPFDPEAAEDVQGGAKKCVLTAALAGAGYRRAMQTILPELHRAGAV